MLPLSDFRKAKKGTLWSFLRELFLTVISSYKWVFDPRLLKLLESGLCLSNVSSECWLTTTQEIMSSSHSLNVRQLHD